MGIDINKYQDGIDRARAKRGGKFWRPKDKEKTNVRLFSFRHVWTKTDQHLERMGKNDQLNMMSEELVAPVTLHFVTGGPPVVCERMAGNQCPLCEEAEALPDEQRGRRQARSQYAVNCVVMDDESMKMLTWTMPESVFGHVFAFLADPEYEYLLGCKGRDFIIDFDKERPPSDMYQVRLREIKHCEVLPVAFQKAAVDLLGLKSYVPKSLHDTMEEDAAAIAAKPPVSPEQQDEWAKELEDSDSPATPEFTLAGLAGKRIQFNGESGVTEGDVIGAEGGQLITRTGDGEWLVELADVIAIVASKTTTRRSTKKTTTKKTSKKTAKKVTKKKTGKKKRR